MGLFRYTKSDERGLMATAFEPDGENYLFYRYHWSRGIPVTAAEREAFLALPFDDERNHFEARIRGRAATGPRRPYWRSYARMIAGFPASVGAAFLAFGAMFLVRGWAGGDPPLLTALWWTAGGLSAGL